MTLVLHYRPVSSGDPHFLFAILSPDCQLTFCLSMANGLCGFLLFSCLLIVTSYYMNNVIYLFICFFICIDVRIELACERNKYLGRYGGF